MWNLDFLLPPLPHLPRNLCGVDQPAGLASWQGEPGEDLGPALAAIAFPQ